MILQLEDWSFDVDLEKTMSYSSQERVEHCNCAYCRNFYAGIDAKYPELRSFLLKFGIHVDAPDRMSALDISSEQIIYDPMYLIFGQILRVGTSTILYEGIEVEPMEAEDGMFYLQIYDLQLPWLLDEPYEKGMSELSSQSASPLQ